MRFYSSSKKVIRVTEKTPPAPLEGVPKTMGTFHRKCKSRQPTSGRPTRCSNYFVFENKTAFPEADHLNFSEKKLMKRKSPKNAVRKRSSSVDQTSSTTNKDKRADHVMISYDWDHQEIVKCLSTALRNAGFTIWLDLEQMCKTQR